MGYYIQDNCFMKEDRSDKDHPVKQLTNFVAEITQQATYHDGIKNETIITIKGTLHDGTPLPELTIPADEFAAMNWIPRKWGLIPVVYPHPSVERDLRTAIQTNSKPVKSNVYTHTGWTTIDGESVYLTSNGGITKDGFQDFHKVQLPNDLARYRLPEPATDREAWAASMRCAVMGKPSITWPLLLATYRAAICSCDFAIHVAGKTGTFKSETCSIMQSHFGDEMDARHLPASWNATANALEALAFKAKNGLMVVDDFVPLGTSWQVRQLQAKADQLIRGQGNQSGRARLTDTSGMQSTYFPRGIILSTGEDIPEGHSVRARMLILDLTPGDIDRDRLTQAQKSRTQLSKSMADWISWLAANPGKREMATQVNAIRDEIQEVGHSRTPTTIANLLATSGLMQEWAHERGYLDLDGVEKMDQVSTKAVMEAAHQQKKFLDSADPTAAFIETIQTMMSSGIAHFRTRSGGIPREAERFGWVKTDVSGEMPTWKPQGPRLGWVDLDDDHLLIDPSSLVLVKKWSGGRLPTTPQTLLKRLKDDGLLARTDDARDRNTVRMTLEGHPHNVIVLDLAQFFPEESD